MQLFGPICFQRTHRQAMSWLKEWDSCVYKNGNSAQALRKKKNLKRAREASGPAETKYSEASKENIDPLGRPQDKVSTYCIYLPLLYSKNINDTELFRKYVKLISFFADPPVDRPTRAWQDNFSTCHSSSSGVSNHGNQRL